ncbi:MAG: alcohol dehydrogenase catalytic domain-containing protein [Chloroflexi bacterium]|nr:alcohol dehydrogenase catalytic domain-containing protein [Chloroflexota bacterium]
MRGLAKTKPGPGLELVDVPRPKAGPFEVLIRSRACGICGGDLHLYQGSEFVSRIAAQGKLPIVIGHEFGGEIVEVGEYVQGFKVGERVAVEPTPGCGHCAQCLKGRPNICKNFFVIGMTQHGGMAEFVRAPVHAVYKVPDTIPDLHLPLLETLGVAVHSLERSPIVAGDAVAVIGAGSIGLLMAQMLKAAGARPLIVTGTSRSQRRLKLAKEMGADVVIAVDKEDVVAKVNEVTDGEGVDVAFEIAGPSSALDQATKISRRGGKIVVAGCTDEVWSWKPFSNARFKETDFIFCRGRTAETWHRGIKLVTTGQVKLAPILDLVLPLERALEGFTRLETDRDVIKIVITPAA